MTVDPVDNSVELNARDYYTRGIARYLEDDVDGAIADFTEAIRLDPQLAAAYVSRGVAQDDPAKALVDYSAAIRVNPEYIQAYYNRGLLRGASGDYAGAISDFTQVLQRQPSHPQAGHIRLDIAEWRKRVQLTDQ